MAKARASVSAAVESYLAGLTLSGVQVVLGQVARVLAAELDDKDAPRYARARLSSELRAVLAHIEEPGVAGDVLTKPDLRRLLAEAASRG